jgi:hypothetical protein
VTVSQIFLENLIGKIEFSSSDASMSIGYNGGMISMKFT